MSGLGDSADAPRRAGRSCPVRAGTLRFEPSCASRRSMIIVWVSPATFCSPTHTTDDHGTSSGSSLDRRAILVRRVGEAAAADRIDELPEFLASLDQLSTATCTRSPPTSCRLRTAPPSMITKVPPARPAPRRDSIVTSTPLPVTIESNRCQDGWRTARISAPPHAHCGPYADRRRGAPLRRAP